MNDNDTDLFDEVRLRRALRLEKAEMPPRLDVAAIVARADSERPTLAVASFASALVAGGAGAVLIAAGAVAVATMAPELAADLFDLALRALANVAAWASWPVRLAQDPTIPMATLTAVAVALAYEFTLRRERLRAVKSS